MKTATQNRARKSGRYTFDGDMDRVCVCGRRLGVHDSEHPHAFGDLSLDDRALPECNKFKPARVKK